MKDSAMTLIAIGFIFKVFTSIMVFFLPNMGAIESGMSVLPTVSDVVRIFFLFLYGAMPYPIMWVSLHMVNRKKKSWINTLSFSSILGILSPFLILCLYSAKLLPSHIANKILAPIFPIIQLSVFFIGGLIGLVLKRKTDGVEACEETE
jgi:hypothetical protein